MPRSADPALQDTHTVLIVDDEPPARRSLRAMLGVHADLEIVGEARSGAEAIAAINSLRPDIVLLDVHMPEGDGFDVIRAIGVEQMPVVIFATAYDAYALQAFDAHALDYLLKPYDRTRLDSALQRARQQLRRRGVDDRLLAFIDKLDERARYQTRLTVRQGTRTQFVAVSQVDYFEAEANYVRVHVGPRSHLIRETLTSLAEQLDPSRFLRVHRSLVVNIGRVVEVESLFSGEYVLLLATGKKLTSGRTYRLALQSALQLKV